MPEEISIEHIGDIANGRDEITTQESPSPATEQVPIDNPQFELIDSDDQSPQIRVFNAQGQSVVLSRASFLRLYGQMPAAKEFIRKTLTPDSPPMMPNSEVTPEPTVGDDQESSVNQEELQAEQEEVNDLIADSQEELEENPAAFRIIHVGGDLYLAGAWDLAAVNGRQVEYLRQQAPVLQGHQEESLSSFFAQCEYGFDFKFDVGNQDRPMEVTIGLTDEEHDAVYSLTGVDLLTRLASVDANFQRLYQTEMEEQIAQVKITRFPGSREQYICNVAGGEFLDRQQVSSFISRFDSLRQKYADMLAGKDDGEAIDYSQAKISLRFSSYADTGVNFCIDDENYYLELDATSFTQACNNQAVLKRHAREQLEAQMSEKVTVRRLPNTNKYILTDGLGGIMVDEARLELIDHSSLGLIADKIALARQNQTQDLPFDLDTVRLEAETEERGERLFRLSGGLDVVASFKLNEATIDQLAALNPEFAGMVQTEKLKADFADYQFDEGTFALMAVNNDTFLIRDMHRSFNIDAKILQQRLKTDQQLLQLCQRNIPEFNQKLAKMLEVSEKHERQVRQAKLDRQMRRKMDIYKGEFPESVNRLMLGGRHSHGKYEQNVPENQNFALSRLEGILNRLTPQNNPYRGDRFFNIMVDDSNNWFRLRTGAFDRLMAFDFRELVRLHGNSRFFRDIFGHQEQYQKYLEIYDRFEADIPRMQKATQDAIEQIVTYYSFRPLDQYPQSQRPQMQEKMSVILCRDIYNNFHYDHEYMDERNIIPYQYQKIYETYIALVEHRGICSSASYALEAVLNYLHVPNSRLSVTSKYSAHAVTAVGGRIYDTTAGNPGIGVSDYFRRSKREYDLSEEGDGFMISIDNQEGRERQEYFTSITEYSVNTDLQGANDMYYDTDYGSIPATRIQEYYDSVERWRGRE